MSQTAISSTSKRSKRSRSTVLVIGILSLANNKSDWWIITFTPFSSDQMIRNLSMKNHLVAAGGGESCHPPITRVARYKQHVDILLVDLLPVELVTE